MTEISINQVQDSAQTLDNQIVVDQQLINEHQNNPEEATTTIEVDSQILLDEITVLPVEDEATLLRISQAKRESSRILHIYLSAVILVNFCLLFLKGYSADLGYWENWIGQLTHNGYNNFNGNYPPFYIHWLYLLGKFYTSLGIPLEANNFLKFLTQIPVTLSHCLLTTIVFSLLNRFNAQRYLLHIIMMLTVFNPTILVNGPIWGQVDLIPVTFIVCALLLIFHDRFSYLAIPMFILALLTKFQMIAFAPVFGFLFFHNFKKNLLGIIIAFVVGSIIFMPAIVAGHFIESFKLAYIDTLGQYPMTTFNAANIWILLTSNTAPDSQILFGVLETSAFAKIFTAKYFGMLSFVCIALWVFMQGMYKQFTQKKITIEPISAHIYEPIAEPITSETIAEPTATEPTPEELHSAEVIPTEQTTVQLIPAEPTTVKHVGKSNQTQTLLAQALFSSMLCAMAFFTLLPAMHERYLFPAAVLALVYTATAQKKLIYPITISLLCSLNMFIILEVNGSDIWHGLAWLMVAITSLCLLETFFGETLFDRLKSASLFVYRLPVLSIWVFLAAVSVMFFSFYDNYRIQQITLKENQILLTALPQISAQQDHGSLQFSKSFDGNMLSLGNRRYAQGLGTHSNSNIQYQLPDDATQFSFLAGLDDEVGIADVQFSVWGDDKLLWESKIYYGYEKDTEINTVDVRGVKILSLKVAALKDDKWDHADWVNTVITVAHNKPSQ